MRLYAVRRRRRAGAPTVDRSTAYVASARLKQFIRREDAELFVEQVRDDDPGVAAKLRIEERELEAGGLNRPTEQSSAAAQR